MSSTCESGACAAPAAATESCCGPAECLRKLDENCPIDGATQMWGRSFGDAMHQAQTEILKAKILKAWGPVLDQSADAMLAAMGALWQAKIAEVKAGAAKQEFKERLRGLWLAEPKKP